MHMTTDSQFVDPNDSDRHDPATFSQVVETLAGIEGREVIVTLFAASGEEDERISFVGVLPAGQIHYHWEHQMLLRYSFNELTHFTILESEIVNSRCDFGSIELGMKNGTALQVCCRGEA